MNEQKNFPSPEKVRELLKVTRITNETFFNYSKRPREYLPGYPVYLREADFLDRISRGYRTMSEIANSLHITQGATTHMALRLEKQGYIIRYQNSDDRRCVEVALTALGEKISKAHQDYWETKILNKMIELLEGYSDEDIERLKNLESRRCALWQSLK